jgi:hypothetical protein
MPLFPLVLVTHIALAVGLLVPSVLLPFALRARGSQPSGGGRLSRALLWLQSRGTTIIGVGLLITGGALVWMLGVQLLRQPWLLVALTIYGANLVVAFFIQRPSLRRLLGLRADATDAERARWREQAKRQRYVSYAMAAAVGVIAFLMSTKPQF